MDFNAPEPARRKKPAPEKHAFSRYAEPPALRFLRQRRFHAAPVISSTHFQTRLPSESRRREFARTPEFTLPAHRAPVIRHTAMRQPLMSAPLWREPE